jgi:hypothetical protein
MRSCRWQEILKRMHYLKRGSFGASVCGCAVLVGEGAVQGVDGAFEVRQVFGDGGLQDGVCGVEVPVCEVVAHPGDLSPRGWQAGWPAGHLGEL